jgi:hypothetical protein
MIQNLDNTEISLVYYQFKAYLETMDETLNKGYHTKKLDINLEEGLSVQPHVVMKISDAEVEMIRDSYYYKSVCSIVEKLRPIIELIEEAEPDIKIKLDE